MRTKMVRTSREWAERKYIRGLYPSREFDKVHLDPDLLPGTRQRPDPDRVLGLYGQSGFLRPRAQKAGFRAAIRPVAHAAQSGSTSRSRYTGHGGDTERGPRED
jgi:hypothetical protein